MGSIDKFPELIKLLRKKAYSPTRIAQEIKSDKRTVNKMLNVGRKLNITACKSIKIEGRRYRVCKLNPKFKKNLGGEIYGRT